MQNRQLKTLIAVLCILTLPSAASFPQTAPDSISRETVAAAERLIDLRFTDAKRDSMLQGLEEMRDSYRALRKIHIKNEVFPSILFNPIPPGFRVERGKGLKMSPPRDLKVPANLEDLAFASVGELASLIKSRKVTSVNLTAMYLSRLKKYGPKLECVITLTEDLAMQQARSADDEIARGVYRGPLHGIPYGAKDLLATKGIRTTWGSAIYRETVPETDATVIRKLEEAGAVLVAKLTLGEFAWGDVWFGGKTRNPWKLEQGSSGSSAGSASATAAGLVGFAIGTETYGSIVSPSTVCGTTGLRPTYGRVSRSGAMALSWSMDKIGPICRTVEDCALVMSAIAGQDGTDPTVSDIPFSYSPDIDLRSLTIGYLQTDFDSAKVNRENNAAVLERLRALGAKLVPVELPSYPVNAMEIILSAEAGAAFDELTLSGKDDLMVRQIKDAWPNVFRTSRMIPAVEYIQANRVRTLLIGDMQQLMEKVDCYLAPVPGGDNLLLTNLTGHPCVVLPDGFSKEGTPTSITFIGRLYDDGRLLAIAKKYQDSTEHHLKHPKLPE